MKPPPSHSRLKSPGIARVRATRPLCGESDRAPGKPRSGQWAHLRTALFNLSPASSRLLIVIHHLSIDGVSWRILLEELTAAYPQAKAGVSIDLPATTTEFARWARRLEKAETDRFQATQDYYRSLPLDGLGHLPVDHNQGPNTVASADRIMVALAPPETEALLRDVPKAFGTQINDVLLTGVSLALAGWSGRAAQWIEVEGHGREPLFPDLDLSRTVGWFTSIWPVLLEPGQPGEPDQPPARLPAAKLVQALSRVREQLTRSRVTVSATGCCATDRTTRKYRASWLRFPQPR